MGSQCRFVYGRDWEFLVLRVGSMLMSKGGLCINMPTVHNLHMAVWELVEIQLEHAQAHASSACGCGVYIHTPSSVPHNNNNTIWRGSVLTGEEPPRHSGELNHALSQVGGPTQIPAIPHLHGAPTAEETSVVKL